MRSVTLIFLILLYGVNSQIMPVSDYSSVKSFNVLINCMAWICGSQLTKCNNEDGCIKKIFQCEPQTRYFSVWNNWYNCTAGNAAAYKLITSCKVLASCLLYYQPKYGVDNMKNYLADANVYQNFLVMNQIPVPWYYSTYYHLNVVCTTRVCTQQTIYCIVNKVCKALYTACLAMSFDNDYSFWLCMRRYSIGNYYLNNLFNCWGKCMF